jgi:excisionase family DNA binding protein
MAESLQMKKEYLTILTVREVAEYLRMSEAKVYRLAKEHCLPAVRIGRTWRFRKDLLDAWLSQRTESSLNEGPANPLVRKLLPAEDAKD